MCELKVVWMIEVLSVGIDVIDLESTGENLRHDHPKIAKGTDTTLTMIKMFINAGLKSLTGFAGGGVDLKALSDNFGGLVPKKRVAKFLLDGSKAGLALHASDGRCSVNHNFPFSFPGVAR